MEYKGYYDGFRQINFKDYGDSQLDRTAAELQKFVLSTVNKKYFIIKQKNEVKRLKFSWIKIEKLQEIFEFLAQTIETECQNRDENFSLSKRKIDQFKWVGKVLNHRYVKVSQGYEHSFLKIVAKFTPHFLKKILPALFSNTIEQEENETQSAYERYQAALNELEKYIKDNTPSDSENDSSSLSAFSSSDEEEAKSIEVGDLGEIQSSEDAEKDKQ